MSSLARKIKRNKKKEVKKDLKEKIGLFDRIPNKCTMCEKPFDKTNKKQVKSWRVAVREKEKKVNLYCEECWNSANEMLKDLKKQMEGSNV